MGYAPCSSQTNHVMVGLMVYRKRPAAKIPGGCPKLERLNSLLPTHQCQFCQDSPITQITIFLGLSEIKFARNLVVSVSPSQVQAQRPVCHRRSRTLERGGRVARPGTQSHQHVFFPKTNVIKSLSSLTMTVFFVISGFGMCEFRFGPVRHFLCMIPFRSLLATRALALSTRDFPWGPRPNVQ